MPTYEYACRSCGHHLEVVQSFSDAPLTECPSCGGSLRKVLHAPGISFKGGGFYKTDSRAPASSSSSSSSSSDGGSGISSGPAGEGSGSSGSSGSGSSTPSSTPAAAAS